MKFAFSMFVVAVTMFVSPYPATATEDHQPAEDLSTRYLGDDWSERIGDVIDDLACFSARTRCLLSEAYAEEVCDLYPLTRDCLAERMIACSVCLEAADICGFFDFPLCPISIEDFE